jgi:hypothetical protein
MTIDTRLHACSQCHSRLTFLGKFTKTGQLAEKREGASTSAYNLFVKDQFQQVKGRMPPGTPIGEVMREIGSSWKEKKAAEEKQQQRERQQEEQWQQQQGQQGGGLGQTMVVATTAVAISLGSDDSQREQLAVSGAIGTLQQGGSSSREGGDATEDEVHEDQGQVSDVLSFMERLDLTGDD